MEILNNPFIFIEYTVAVILISELIKRNTRLHGKWVALIAGLMIGVVGWLVGLMDLHGGKDFYKLLSSYAVANLFYDYVLRVIYDRFKIKPR